MIQDGIAVDMLRWTFTVGADAVEAVETHLSDLGADVFVRDGGTFHVTWDEPDADLDPVVEAIWGLAGEHFEITQEEFHRLNLHLLQHDSGETDEEDFEAGADPEETETGDEADGLDVAAEEAEHPSVEPLEIRKL